LITFQLLNLFYALSSFQFSFSLHGWTTPLTINSGCSRVLVWVMTMLMTPQRCLVPATGDDVPVCTTKVAITQRVADWIDRTVDIAQPVTYQQQN